MPIIEDTIKGTTMGEASMQFPRSTVKTFQMLPASLPSMVIW
jgi:hypothetical protein